MVNLQNICFNKRTFNKILTVAVEAGCHKPLYNKLTGGIKMILWHYITGTYNKTFGIGELTPFTW